MKNAILSILCGFLALWLLTGCGWTGEQESASVPPMQPASGELPTARPDGPGAASDAPSQEAVSSEALFSQAVSSTPDPAENTSGIPAPSEAVSASPGFSETVSAVKLILQDPELPNGCEVTSLAMLLDWAGYPIDKVELSDQYLPKQGFYRSNEVLYGADPNQAYAGDPSSSSSGWYCFEGPVLEAANAYLSDQNTTQQAAPLSAATREELENYMNDGIPLAAWVTLDYSEPRSRASSVWRLPDGTDYVPYTNLHCVVLAGWDGENYRIANPVDGWQSVSPDTFWSCFDAMGRRAVAVLPN